MMEPTHLWDRDDPSGLWRLDGAKLGCVLLQAQLRATPMIIVRESSQVAIQASFAEYCQPSRPGDLHPEALTEPDISLSTYPARATA